jgi:7-cyano-7-deazaguanine synthase
MSGKDVLVLLSGGLDSTTLAAKALSEGRLAAVLFVDYSQANRHQEDRSTYSWCKDNGVERHIFTLGGWSRVSETNLSLRSLSSALHVGVGEPGPRVVPNRNMILVAGAIHYAASLGCTEVWIGPTADDQENYADCRPEWVESANRMASFWGISVVAPFIGMYKREVVALAHQLGVDISATWSCYQPNVYTKPCGTCNACVLRASSLT